MADDGSKEYFTGGFDIMKKWQEAQTGRRRPKEYFTGGFDIMKKWQEAQTGRKHPENSNVAET